MNNCIFTITAKNYLAQALTLKESIKVLYPQIDFYIFLADINDKNIEIENLIELNESWIPNYKSMAFKYNLIEFTTSIKPFCFQYLLKKYKKAIYFDPDIYVYNNIDFIFEYLNNYDILFTPHRVEMIHEYNKDFNEEVDLFVGIFNLGFIALNNSDIANKILNWWKSRLEAQGYAEIREALHVDQKWMDFIPTYFPNNHYIIKNIGCNFAYWNMHERKLNLEQNKYFVINKINNTVETLIFYHFSSFIPTNPHIIDNRIPESNINKINEYQKKFYTEYANRVINNQYFIYKKYNYSFNYFFNNNLILPIHRRFYRVLFDIYNNEDCFKVESKFYQLLKNNKLVYNNNIINQKANNIYVSNNKKNNKLLIHLGLLILRIFKFIFGIKFYCFLLKFCEHYSKLENNIFLIKKNK